MQTSQNFIYSWELNIFSYSLWKIFFPYARVINNIQSSKNSIYSLKFNIFPYFLWKRFFPYAHLQLKLRKQYANVPCSRSAYLKILCLATFRLYRTRGSMIFSLARGFLEVWFCRKLGVELPDVKIFMTTRALSQNDPSLHSPAREVFSRGEKSHVDSTECAGRKKTLKGSRFLR